MTLAKVQRYSDPRGSTAGAIFAMGPEEGERGESFEVSGGNLSIIKAYVVSGTGGLTCGAKCWT